jgi:hypothetical protein
MANQIDFAHEELIRIGAPTDVISSYIDVIQAYTDAQLATVDSGGLNVMILKDLLLWQPLTPLTNDPAEWSAVGDRLWQSTRNPEAFSYDQGITYYLLSERDIDPTSIHISMPKADAIALDPNGGVNG